MPRPLLKAVHYTRGNHVSGEPLENRDRGDRAALAEFERITSRLIGPVEVLESNPTPTQQRCSLCGGRFQSRRPVVLVRRSSGRKGEALSACAERHRCDRPADRFDLVRPGTERFVELAMRVNDRQVESNRKRREKHGRQDGDLGGLWKLQPSRKPLPNWTPSSH